MSRPIPPDTAPTAELVEYARWNDRNGNWPELVPHDDPRIGTAERAGTISPPINAAHVWYDHEQDCWLHDEECRAQMLAILTAWRAEDEADDHHGREGRPNYQQGVTTMTTPKNALIVGGNAYWLNGAVLLTGPVLVDHGVNVPYFGDPAEVDFQMLEPEVRAECHRISGALGLLEGTPKARADVALEAAHACLTEILDDYCTRHGMPQMSADELAQRDGLSRQQAAYLEAFVQSWDCIDTCQNTLGTMTTFDKPSTRELLAKAAEFIEGFEDDTDQEGIPALLADIRRVLAGGAS